ncbi:Protein of unknown function [Pyronema omphalodes CBS 100304]|uniref:Uncharacterized protein n=1 Tax=Pyronema omphalodes (strain CBS 100304) TaxID=1076935 RepID=U4LI52_PYROM|nr:Protein of unknown function [Pyronema omphalodes CBS 100304]
MIEALVLLDTKLPETIHNCTDRPQRGRNIPKATFSYNSTDKELSLK